MKGLRAIIFEDEGILAMGLTLMLENMGHEVFEPLSYGEEAAEMVMTQKPDIVFMDIQLDGDVNGIMAVEAIRKQTDVPVIFMTGNADAETIATMKSFSNATYLIKPYSFEAVENAILTMLAK